MNKLSIFLVLSLVLSACSSIPEKVPELIQASSTQINTQSTVAAREWEKAIAASRSAYRMLELIEPLTKGINTASLSDSEKDILKKFNAGLPIVKKQLKSNIDNASLPNQHLANVKKITDAIDMANQYVAEVADENSRIQAVINNIQSIQTTLKE